MMRKISAALFMCASLAAADPAVEAAGVGARAYGMGGCFTALADDFSALYWNPAGLAFVPVREVHCAFDGGLHNAETVLSGRSTPSYGRSLRIHSAGFLRSVPTVRGGFAFALGFSSPWLLDDLLDYSGPDVYQGTAGLAGAGDTLYPGDTLFSDRCSRRAVGRCNLWSAGLGWQVAPGLGFGFSLGLLSGSERIDLTAVTHTANGAFEDFDERMERAYLGYDARLGLLYRPSTLFSAGIRLELPRRAAVAENRGSVDYLTPGGGGMATDFGVLRSAFSAAAGIALKLPAVTVSCDAAFRGPAGGAPEGSEIDGWKFGAGAGVEAPLRPLAGVVRCGYSWTQPGLSSMAIAWEETGFDEPGAPRVINGRHLVTAGYSLFLGSVASLELAYGMSFRQSAAGDPDWQNELTERHLLQRGVLSFSIRY
jgi:hypothetical protein